VVAVRGGFQWLKAFAGGNAKQVNVAGDNFGPIYLGPKHDRRSVHQLPAAPADFSGRVELAAQVRRRLTDGSGPRMVNLYGIPGVGKSALGLRLAHALSDEPHYPDHQLYFDLREYDDLRAYDQRQGSTYDLLGGALVALGTAAAEVPSGLGPRAAAYRSALAAERTLVVIDNASTAAEVEPLLPGHFRSAVIITSWAPITDLAGVQVVPVQVLGDDEAVEMLRTVSGRDLGPGDEAVAREIVKCAGHLPLALRIAGGLLKVRPMWAGTTCSCGSPGRTAAGSSTGSPPGNWPWRRRSISPMGTSARDSHGRTGCSAWRPRPASAAPWPAC
jgi:hypothetical protein